MISAKTKRRIGGFIFISCIVSVIIPMIYCAVRVLVEYPQQRLIALAALGFVVLLLIGIKLIDSK